MKKIKSAILRGKLMRCEANNCRENKYGYCHCDSCIAINKEGLCDKYFPIEINNTKNTKGKPYTNIIHVFQDLYNRKRIKHNDKPDKIFVYGDIVTSNCGFDLGFHSGVKGQVYARPTSYYDKPMYGGYVEWYKTGVNVTWEEWQKVAEDFRLRY